jgi:hypothetical protein
VLERLSVLYPFALGSEGIYWRRAGRARSDPAPQVRDPR